MGEGAVGSNGNSALSVGTQSPAAASHASSYRPDIDGLRAVAVVPVVLFHAGVGIFGGGYVGVDVFFVISGFLITRILAGSMQEGRYSILDFYDRRARRIFPALAAMVAAVLVAGYIILPPTEFKGVGNSALSIGAFLSNFYFWKSVGYFESSSSFHPLLHTWSLAVEEQFYIFFPFVLYFLHGNRKLLLPLLAAILAVSFAGAVLLIDLKPRIVFYLLPCRAWELMAGGILALGVFERFWSVRRAIVASVVGIAMILGPIFAYTATTPFPGVAAVPPVLGSCLLIWSRGEGVGRVLAIRPMVWIGLISYSLYLWHLPIFEFAKYLLGGTLPLEIGLALSVISVIVAWLSLRFIERPFRVSKSTAASRKPALLASAGLLTTTVAGLALVVTQGLPGRMSPDSARILAVSQDQSRHHLECMSLDEVWIDPEHACKLGGPGRPTALLWGDSHSLVTATALEVAARRNGGAFLFAADADCPIGLGFGIEPTITPAVTGQGHYRRCGDYNSRMLKVAMRPEIRTVVLSARWTNWRIGEPPNDAESVADIRFRTSAGVSASMAANRTIFETGFIRLVDTLRGAGKAVVIVGPVPEPRFNVPARAYVSQFGAVDAPAALTMTDYSRRHATILRFFDTLRGKVRFVWPVEKLCPEGRCTIVERDGTPRYFDHNHLSVSAARSTAPLYDFVFTRSATEGSGR